MDKGFKILMNDLSQNVNKRLEFHSYEKVLHEYYRTLNNYLLIKKIEREIPDLKYWGLNIFEFIELYNSQRYKTSTVGKWNLFIKVIRELRNDPGSGSKELRDKMKPVFAEFDKVYLKPKARTEKLIRSVVEKEVKVGGVKLNSAGDVPKVNPITAKQTALIEDFVHQSEPLGPFMGHGTAFRYQTGINNYRGGASVNQHATLNKKIPEFMAPPPPGGPVEMPGIHGASGALPRGGWTTGPPPINKKGPVGPVPPGGPFVLPGVHELPIGIAPGSGQLRGGQPAQRTQPADYFIIDQNEPEGFEIIIRDGKGRRLKIKCKDIIIEDDKKKVR